MSSAFVPRRAAESVREALADTRVVLVNGARQSGKSTLVRRIGKDHGADWYTLDDADTQEFAARDSRSFVRLAQRMIIDDVQRIPALLLAIKALVDEEPDPGRFLLTGSSRLLAMRDLPDTLVGRMETIELWPLSQGEIDATPDGFVDAAFALGPELRHESSVDRTGYIERIVRGGFPDAVRRAPGRREQYFESYVADMIDRDVMQVWDIERGREMHALVRLLAARSGQIMVPASLSNGLEVSAQTVRRYLALLEEVFLIKQIPAWTRNLNTRSIAKSKLAFVDSGVAAALLDQDASRLRKPGSPLGGLLEGFVAMEIARQLTWSRTRAELFHYRTRDQVEVDIVLENRRGEVIAIEVKSSATPSTEDFRGIRHLHERVGDDLVAGYVLHAGPHTLPFGNKYRAVPISALWETAPA
ncbi:ATP-binding protein [Myceligenerans indicum]|uniref:ATP-binding protein n=1 Tax=Myceligenerans indicum TaxID=2593663 RepID=UPI00191CFB75|nr:ATP-binding protein [Myceligenerans indicum]